MAQLHNAGSTWTHFELNFLITEFNGHRSHTEVIAELLGRTVAACETRFYEWKQGRDQAQAFKNVPSGETHYASTAYRAAQARLIAPIKDECPACHLEMPLTGECC